MFGAAPTVAMTDGTFEISNSPGAERDADTRYLLVKQASRGIAAVDRWSLTTEGADAGETTMVPRWVIKWSRMQPQGLSQSPVERKCCRRRANHLKSLEYLNRELGLND